MGSGRLIMHELQELLSDLAVDSFDFIARQVPSHVSNVGLMW
jgi:hypothetical protein